MSKTAKDELKWWKETNFQETGIAMEQLRITSARIISYSDASTNHWGFQSSLGNSADGDFPEELRQAPIIVKEAYACYKGLLTFTKPCEIYLYIDNLGLHYALKKTRSSNAQVNAYIMR